MGLLDANVTFSFIGNFFSCERVRVGAGVKGEGERREAGRRLKEESMEGSMRKRAVQNKNKKKKEGRGGRENMGGEEEEEGEG